MKHINQIVSLLMLLIAIGFNLVSYRLEPTAAIDPNDNAFQFGLVDRTNQIWDFAVKKCSATLLTFPVCFPSYLIDHWVPNWAEGYNLPFYYSHIPQIVIVASWRLVNPVFTLFGGGMGLFAYYHLLIYLLLSLFPLSVFLALRIAGFPFLTAGIGALFSTHLSTDGLYGLDPSSFLWRGYGLSSQLFAMIFMPPAVACSFRYFREDLPDSITGLLKLHFFGGNNHPNGSAHPESRFFWLSVLFLMATTMGHLGLGVMAMLSVGVMAFSTPLLLILSRAGIHDIAGRTKTAAMRLLVLCGTAIFFLSYWILPIQTANAWHTISFWDPVWKFNSYGAKDVVRMFLNGDLLDFGRFPVLTLLTIAGFFAMIWPKNGESTNESRPLALLFPFWLVMFFGRTTWGPLIDLIPGMKEFHISRFIVGLHLASMLIAPVGISAIIDGLVRFASGIRFQESGTHTSKFLIPNPAVLTLILTLAALIIVIPPLYRQTITYNELNNTLILQANRNHAAVQKDVGKAFQALKKLPAGRVFAGRGGWWGKNFRIAETPYYMHLSTYGIPTVLWLPETWSPNSDTEQYFSEDQAKDYDLYNIRYVLTPPDQQPQQFWKLREEAPTWKLYDVVTTGYFTVGKRTMTVISNKEHFINIVRLWIQSPVAAAKLFPELSLTGSVTTDPTVPVIRMTDEVTYKTSQGSAQNIFDINPIYAGDPPAATLAGPEKVESDMIFETKVTVDKPCPPCLVVLKQSYHPNWQATVNGKPASTIEVFPSYTAVVLPNPGTYEIVMQYQPSPVKMMLFFAAGALGAFLVLSKLRRHPLLRIIAARAGKR